MTMPTEAPATGAGTGTSTTTEPAAEPIDWQARAEAAEAEAAAQKAHNRKIEQRYKNQKATKTAEPSTETDEDPRVKAATATAAEARVEARLTKLAASHSPEALALVDSITFRDEVDNLDFDTLAEFDELVNELIKKKLGAKRKSTPAAQSTSGGEFAGGSGAASPITEAQLKAMTPAQRVEALDKGLLKHLL